nr:S24 family peptidase [Alphaproteobacteria bacterium]
LVPQYAGLRVEGESMWPFYSPGDVVYVRLEDHTNISELYGIDCVCETTDGIYLKRVQRSADPKCVDLESINPAYQLMPAMHVLRARPVSWIHKVRP